jgi:hypothetical protein
MTQTCYSADMIGRLTAAGKNTSTLQPCSAVVQ